MFEFYVHICYGITFDFQWLASTDMTDISFAE